MAILILLVSYGAALRLLRRSVAGGSGFAGGEQTLLTGRVVRLETAGRPEFACLPRCWSDPGLCEMAWRTRAAQRYSIVECHQGLQTRLWRPGRPKKAPSGHTWRVFWVLKLQIQQAGLEGGHPAQKVAPRDYFAGVTGHPAQKVAPRDYFAGVTGHPAQKVAPRDYFAGVTGHPVQKKTVAGVQSAEEAVEGKPGEAPSACRPTSCTSRSVVPAGSRPFSGRPGNTDRYNAGGTITTGPILSMHRPAPARRRRRPRPALV